MRPEPASFFAGVVAGTNLCRGHREAHLFFSPGTGLACETDLQKSMSEVPGSDAGGACDDACDGAGVGNLFVTGGLLHGGPSHCDPMRGQREVAGCSLLLSLWMRCASRCFEQPLRGCSENTGMFRVLEPVDKLVEVDDPCAVAVNDAEGRVLLRWRWRRDLHQLLCAVRRAERPAVMDPFRRLSRSLFFACLDQSVTPTSRAWWHEFTGLRTAILVGYHACKFR